MVPCLGNILQKNMPLNACVVLAYYLILNYQDLDYVMKGGEE
jgi:hypothetical protein